MSFQLGYHPDVTKDVATLDNRLKKRIKTAIENRLSVAPEQYGEPLRKTLKGYWKLRVGDYRVVFKITGEQVLILGIIHRKEVYEKIGSRTKNETTKQQNQKTKESPDRAFQQQIRRSLYP